jgi:hypothetical protein
MTTYSLFDSVEHAEAKPTAPSKLRILITVKAAPNPSSSYGETVCVAGIRLNQFDLPQAFVRLYPINFRYLPYGAESFSKYDIVTVDCTPATEARKESWNPKMMTLKVLHHIKEWKDRRSYLDPLIDVTMCEINRNPETKSLALVKARQIRDLKISRHPGWTAEEQAKIDKYVSQPELPIEGAVVDKAPLKAPRFLGKYEWLCHDTNCKGHNQEILDGSLLLINEIV